MHACKCALAGKLQCAPSTCTLMSLNLPDGNIWHFVFLLYFLMETTPSGARHSSQRITLWWVTSRGPTHQAILPTT